MPAKLTDKYVITYHFLERYVYRFQDNRLETILLRINRLKKLSMPEFNRVKKITQNSDKRDLLIDKDMVVVIKNDTLVTCWRLT